MNYGFIKNRICVNVAIFKTLEEVENIKKGLIPNVYNNLVLCDEGFGIGDIYDGNWKKAELKPIELTPEERIKLLEQKLEITQNILDEIALGGTI